MAPRSKPKARAGIIRTVRNFNPIFAPPSSQRVAAISMEYPMRNNFYSARDAAKNFGALVEDADAGPVTVYRHGRPHAVVLSARLFKDYRKAYDEAFDDRQIRIFELRLQALMEGKLGKSYRASALGERLRKGLASLDDVPMPEPANSE